MARARVLLLCLFALSLSAQQIDNATVKSTDASRGVGATITAIGSTNPTWFAWSVPIKGRSICCWNDGWKGGGRNGCCGRCKLEGNNGFSINDDEDDIGVSQMSEMLIVARVEQGRVRRVRLFNTTCGLDGQGKTIQLLTNVSPESSVDFFLSQIRNADREGEMLAALSMHEHPRVIPSLIQLARHDPETEVRRHALFWLGQRAGVKVAGELRRAVDEDPDEDVKEHAVFAISQLPRERSVPLLIDLVKTHKSRKVRERALFWLAQTGDQRAVDLIESILIRE
ncbi:MAG TPA: HEAT repeat domain-containing protein [Thermoanaerobaculia bacterium]|nr:HEAT repeat domain-containing protein [Thermoanaerobaculia bacterium]